MISRRIPSRQPESRQRMIAETSRFLSWALRERPDLPRIPCRRVDAGGYRRLTRIPGARAVLDQWWKRILNQVRT